MDDRVTSVAHSRPRIFQIGFNKCGTTSIHALLSSSGIKSIHWDRGRLSNTIKSNIERCVPPLTGYDDFVAFLDMEHILEEGGYYYSYRKYQLLDECYPGSSFILNVRDVDKWVESRLAHSGYLLESMRASGGTFQEVVREWKAHFRSHVLEVEEYFSGRDCLLKYNIEEDSSEKLLDFLAARGWPVVDGILPHIKHEKIARLRSDKEIIETYKELILIYEARGEIERAKQLCDFVVTFIPGTWFLERARKHSDVLFKRWRRKAKRS